MKKQKNRWIMLFCICCNTFCFGGVYAWSAFSGELANYMGWDYSKVTVAYSIMLMCVALMGYYAVCKLRYPCRLCLRIWL